MGRIGRREYHDRNARAPRAGSQATQHVKPILLRQMEIEQHQDCVRRIGFGLQPFQKSQRFFAVAEHTDFMIQSVIAQRQLRKIHVRFIVFRQQNAALGTDCRQNRLSVVLLASLRQLSHRLDVPDRLSRCCSVHYLTILVNRLRHLFGNHRKSHQLGGAE